MKLGIKCTIENYWKNLLQHYWSVRGVSLGMVRWSPDESIFVNSEFASLYCSKYMFKSDNLLINEKVKEYYDEFGQLPDDGKKKGSLTTHWQSLHFGESLKKNLMTLMYMLMALILICQVRLRLVRLSGTLSHPI